MATNTPLSEQTDAEFAATRTAVADELERRLNLASIPAQVAALTTAYASAGGDVAEINAAVESGTPTDD